MRRNAGDDLCRVARLWRRADASHITQPDKDGVGAQRMEMALRDAKVDPSRLATSTHGTATPLGDQAETVGIKSVFKEHAYRLSVSSTKSQLGHMLGASGGVELVLSVLALKHGVIPRRSTTRIPTRPAIWTTRPIRLGSERSPWPCPTVSALAATTPRSWSVNSATAPTRSSFCARKPRLRGASAPRSRFLAVLRGVCCVAAGACPALTLRPSPPAQTQRISKGGLRIICGHKQFSTSTRIAIAPVGLSSYRPFRLVARSRSPQQEAGGCIPYMVAGILVATVLTRSALRSGRRWRVRPATAEVRLAHGRCGGHAAAA